MELWVSPGRSPTVISVSDRRGDFSRKWQAPLIEVSGEGLGKFSWHKFLKPKNFLNPVKHFKAMRHMEVKFYQKTVPKSIRKHVRADFIKYAPILAAVAQLLNVIPGLGLAVGAAILAGSVVLAASVAVLKVQDAKKQAAKIKAAQAAQDKADAAAAAQDQSDAGTAGNYAVSGLGIDMGPPDPSTLSASEVQAKEAEAHAKSNEAFAIGSQFFLDKYGVDQATFEKMDLQDKMDLFQTAVEDAAAEKKATGHVSVTGNSVGGSTGPLIVLGLFLAWVFWRR